MPLKLVQYNFNHAASTYLENASLQKSCAQKLLASLQQYHTSGLLLDLGSGPGTLLHQPGVHTHSTICYDISLAMLKTGKKHHAGLAVNGDASTLPFAANSIQTVISNLMLQWPIDKSAIFAEINRVLAPGGHLIFTTLIEPSLWQLQQAWRELDSARHTLDFLPATNYQALCQTAGMRILKAEAWQHEMHFPTIPTLLQHFKTTGTSLPKTNCSQGLGGKKSLHALTSAYPRKDAKASFPLSYHPLLLMAKKDFLHG